MIGDSDDVAGATSWRVATLSPLKVRADGQSAQVFARTLASYTPVVGDLVATIPLDVSRRLILGKIT